MSSGAAADDITRDLEAIFRAGLASVDPAALVRDNLARRGDLLMVGSGDKNSTMDLRSFRSIVALGAGKASARMALAIEEILGPRLDGGVIAVKRGGGERLQRCTVIEAGHPVPDEDSVQAAELVARAATAADEGTLVICLISGGASSILCMPQGVSLAEKRALTGELLRSGATIHEMNAVRKHLSGIKGGRLARMMQPATSVSLILSDVVGDDLDVIGSGMTVPDASTYAQALEVLQRRGIRDRVPSTVVSILESGARGLLPESPKPGDRVFESCQTRVIGSNALCARAAAERARQLGYDTRLVTTPLQGEAREAAAALVLMARAAAVAGGPGRLPACIVAGGETTVTVRGSGRGGRNQELALAFLADAAGSDIDGRAWLLSASTDGIDGPTDAAGAFASRNILNAARGAGLDHVKYLAENDSYSYFDRAGGLLRTGPTGTNVCDLQIMIVR